MSVLVDSDILIEVARGRNSDITRKWIELGESQSAILCSPVSVAELWRGVLPHEEGFLADLFQLLACVPIDAATGRKAGEFLRTFRKSHDLEIGDALIAASAVQNDAALWTRNRKHYPMEGISFF